MDRFEEKLLGYSDTIHHEFITDILILRRQYLIASEALENIANNQKQYPDQIAREALGRMVMIDLGGYHA